MGCMRAACTTRFQTQAESKLSAKWLQQAVGGRVPATDLRQVRVSAITRT